MAVQKIGPVSFINLNDEENDHIANRLCEMLHQILDRRTRKPGDHRIEDFRASFDEKESSFIAKVLEEANRANKLVEGEQTAGGLLSTISKVIGRPMGMTLEGKGPKKYYGDAHMILYGSIFRFILRGKGEYTREAYEPYSFRKWLNDPVSKENYSKEVVGVDFDFGMHTFDMLSLISHFSEDILKLPNHGVLAGIGATAIKTEELRHDIVAEHMKSWELTKPPMALGFDTYFYSSFSREAKNQAVTLSLPTKEGGMHISRIPSEYRRAYPLFNACIAPIFKQKTSNQKRILFVIDEGAEVHAALRGLMSKLEINDAGIRYFGGEVTATMLRTTNIPEKGQTLAECFPGGYVGEVAGVKKVGRPPPLLLKYPNQKSITCGATIWAHPDHDIVQDLHTHFCGGHYVDGQVTQPIVGVAFEVAFKDVIAIK